MKLYSNFCSVYSSLLRQLFLLAIVLLGTGLLNGNFFNTAGPVDYFSTRSFAAENRDRAQQELDAVDTAIEEIQSWLLDAHEKQSREEKNLQEAEAEIAAVSHSVSTIQQNLSQTESQMDLLRNRSAQLESDKTVQGDLLAQAIRTAYMTGEKSPIKLLLSQEDISEGARMLYYQRLFSESQVEKIKAFQNTLDEIAEVNRSLEDKADELSTQQNQLQQQVLVLNEAKSSRERVLLSLQASIRSRGSELEQLEIDQAELQQLIDQINRAIERIPPSVGQAPFVAQRGKLLLPAEGPIISRFGSRYGDGDLRRQGITIGVSEGTPVQAVHAGRIVFSDWLRGSGLLVIVDHGDGYMSLYGANQALSRQAGEWVDSGDILATSGAGSAQNQPGIYFEIRLHGEAQNPATWIKSTN